MLGKRRTTHVRVYKDILVADRMDHPDLTFNQIHLLYRDMYNGVQKAGRIMYGNAWRRKKK